MAAGPAVELTREGDRQVLVFSGDWQIDGIAGLQGRVDTRVREVAGGSVVVFRGEGLGRVDTAGAWLLERAAAELEGRGVTISWEGFPQAWQEILRPLAALAQEGGAARPRRSILLDPLEDLGRKTVEGADHLVAALGFLGRLTLAALYTLVHPLRFRLGMMVATMYRAGVTAIPIIALMAFLISIVIAYQGAFQLARFGAEIFTINLTAVSLLREMGVLLTALLVAGRSGSAFAAEIGVMKVNEEVDAMQTMGMDPFEVLVFPRVLALVVMLPLLTLLADLAGLAGGALSAHLLMGVSLDQFLTQVRTSLSDTTFWVGIIKAPVFGFLIATAGTFWGMRVAGSAEGVGQVTTIAVVQSIFMVIVADASFSILFSLQGW
jgi:phospholipid/cholesterol/gamma-HCH transport system permease protein